MKPCYLVNGWINQSEATHTFNLLKDTIPWLGVAGNRLEYWTNTLDKPYTYGQGVGQRTYSPQPADPRVTEFAYRLKIATDVDYNACFLNYYRDGDDGIGWHSDDDPQIDHTKPIAVVTFGDGRRIEWKSKERGSHPEGCYLENGSLFVMTPGMQQTHFHRIPKMSVDVGERISLTYRVLKNE